jgi:hypothetical protein
MGPRRPMMAPITALRAKFTIEKFEKDVRVQIFDDYAIWKLIYFGKARLPTQ